MQSLGSAWAWAAAWLAALSLQVQGQKNTIYICIYIIKHTTDLRRIKSQSSSTCKWVVDDANGYYKVYNSISICVCVI